MTKLRARIGRFEAPVDYGEIRPWLQRVRATGAGIVLVAALFSVLFDAPSAGFQAAMAAAVMAHAFLRARVPHSATEVLVIDALAVSIVFGGPNQTAAPLIAAAAYLIAASVTFGGLRSLMWALGSFGLSIVVRPFLPIPDSMVFPVAAEIVDWVTISVFLGALALTLMTAATEVFKAKRVQQAALSAERRASAIKNEFVSMVTHELRTPLTNIAGFAETLEETWQDLEPADVEEFLRIIVSESEHLKNLVEDVLAIPRLEAGRLLMDSTDFALRPATFKIIDLLFPEGGAKSASVSVDSKVIIHADPNRVEQILRNLFENARKYGGETVSVEAIPMGDQWQVIVSDNGTGLSTADQERVFKAFEQVTVGDSRTGSGFGLGLTVARHLVDAMGGRIWYEPGFPVGARFCFTLPAGQAKTGTEEVARVA